MKKIQRGAINYFFAAKQRGATMWSTLTIMLMLGFIVYFGAIVGNAYLDFGFIRGAMQSVVDEPSFKQMTKKEILSRINKMLIINNIRGLEPDVISIKKELKGNDKYLHIVYSAKSEMIANVSIITEFDEEIRPGEGK